MECRKCSGTGQTLEHRSRWIGGGKSGYRSEWDIPVTCQRCDGTGIDPEPDPAVAAPGFTPETFAAGLVKACVRYCNFLPIVQKLQFFGGLVDGLPRQPNFIANLFLSAARQP